ncbi:prenyltransferase/squalene oxidase repeat-containing protein [Nocardioides sp. S-58]|uniref:Prenyltransferase/squalene oxidase repeat-containing protein n=1 Tax=Nocardioides renjunii TaxID=3095075 RepID=A0ABU5KGS0_9ACTN|nr:prenyltransferase/squalene oxidase repeat-containing protein [Nocardioides sp. S-58]MDZ5664043.1 prenyltransferase/squalene oxidase repeat-containing protein [Nocardioides sp. S-58]
MHHRNRPIRTAALALSTAALGIGVLAAPPASADPSPALRAAQAAASTDSTPSTIAAEWIAGELSNGLITTLQGPDFGLTIDTGLALATVASQGGTVTAINNSLEPRIGEYVGDGTKESYAGALGKAATFARTAKKNPTSYGGVNLIARLEERTANVPADPAAEPQAAAFAGRIFDKSEFGNFANVVGQSYAVRALTLAGSAEAGAARDFLLKQQCASGYFRLDFAKADVPNQSCTEGAAGSEADPDATALAVINLVESGDRSAAVQGALAKAGTWLAGRQRGSGAIRSAGAGASINTNSTAVGGYALGLLKNRDAALKAALWIRKNQPVDKYKCRTALTRDTGAVAYRRDRVTAATTTGIPADARGEWRRATAQAILGLQFAPASKDKLRIVSVRREARAGDNVQFQVYGLAPSESACMQVKGDFLRVKGKKSGAKIVRKLQLPTGNQRRVALVKTSDDEARTSLRVRN